MKTTLTKKYCITTHVMFYEIEMYKEYIAGLCNVLETIENKENIYIDLCLNMQEYLELIDTTKISKHDIRSIFQKGISELHEVGISVDNITAITVDNNQPMYFHTDSRRNANYKYCNLVDYVIFGETDSFMPHEGLQAIETLAQYNDSQNIHRYIMSFADRKM